MISCRLNINSIGVPILFMLLILLDNHTATKSFTRKDDGFIFTQLRSPLGSQNFLFHHQPSGISCKLSLTVSVASVRA